MRVLRFLLILSAVLVFAAPSRAEVPPIFLLKWGTNSSGDGQFLSPAHVAVDTSGNVYVGKMINRRIQKFGASLVDSLAPSLAILGTSTCKTETGTTGFIVDELQRVAIHPAGKVEQLTPRLWTEHFAANPLRSDIDTARRTLPSLIVR